MYKNLSLEDFINDTASSAPVPGGGSVAALTGALASALSTMVANLTIGKKKYVEVENQMIAIKEKLTPIHMTFLDLIDKDSASFDLVMRAMKLPKETEADKIIRTNTMQEALVKAAEAPYEIAVLAGSLFDDIAFLVSCGNANAQTDALVAAMLARTSILSALYNVKINLLSITDEHYVKEMTAKVSRLELMAMEREAEILKLSSL